MPDSEKKSLTQRLAEAKIECAMQKKNKASNETSAASSDAAPVIVRDYPRFPSIDVINESDESDESDEERRKRKEKILLLTEEMNRCTWFNDKLRIANQISLLKNEGTNHLKRHRHDLER